LLLPLILFLASLFCLSILSEAKNLHWQLLLLVLAFAFAFAFLVVIP
jgi:formate/nitrite transporter FocA (FNT family)